MNPRIATFRFRVSLAALGAAVILSAPARVLAQVGPTLLSSDPTNNASGVSTAAPITFRFSEALDPDATYAILTSGLPPQIIQTIDSWSDGNTKLICTPESGWPSNSIVQWILAGQNPAGDPLTGPPPSGLPSGQFRTGQTGGDTGSGTNAFTVFSLSQVHAYTQTTAAVPEVDTDVGYGFLASTTLSSNRTATTVTVTPPAPGSQAVTLARYDAKHPEWFSFLDYTNNLTALNDKYPPGDYVYRVMAATSNQTATVNFPSSLLQPNAPYVTNYDAAQGVNPAQAFTLSWDRFQGGTAADFIKVQVGGLFSTGDCGAANALDGTVTSVTIPANTFEARALYDATVEFVRFVGTTNLAEACLTEVSRATVTSFTVKTGAGAASTPLVLTNAVLLANGAIQFAVATAADRAFSIETTTNLSSSIWAPLLITNSLTGTVVVTDLPTDAKAPRFYRARAAN